MNTVWPLVLIFSSAATLCASTNQFSYSNSGGTVSESGTTLEISSSTLSNPAGTVAMSCPLTYILLQWTCSGGSLSVKSADGTLVITGAFTSGIFIPQQRIVQGVTSYSYAFYADFAGSRTINGNSAAIVGSVSEILAAMTTTLNLAPGTIQTGLIDISQRYEPVYIADTGNNRIVQTADILGSNWTSIGTLGTGVKQFSAPWGIARDSTGRIYVSDSGNCRIVRMDNISGLNWTSFGACGWGTGQFSGPEGLWVDSSPTSPNFGKIYVADTGNNRVVRVDDMTGANFISLGSGGNGAGQFNKPAAVTTDPAGNIYVADSANARVVEFSNMLGSNWAVLQFPLNYLTPDGIALDSAKRIYLTDSLQSQVIRADNISGANMVTLNVDYLNYFYDVLGPSGLFVDPDGAIYVADTKNNRALRFFDMSFNDVFAMGTLGKGLGHLAQPHGVAAVRVSTAIPVSTVTPRSLAFPTEVVGKPSPAERTVLTNIGTAPFTVGSVLSSSADFPLTQNCPATLVGGEYCSASIVFQPTGGGLRTGTATFSLTGATSRTVGLSGHGALISLNWPVLQGYPSGLIMYESQAGTVTVTNPLSTPTAVTAIKVSYDFYQTNNCGPLAPAGEPGSSCTITITLEGLLPLPVLGTLAVTDSLGTIQYVQLNGE